MWYSTWCTLRQMFFWSETTSFWCICHFDCKCQPFGPTTFPTLNPMIHGTPFHLRELKYWLSYLRYSQFRGLSWRDHRPNTRSLHIQTATIGPVTQRSSPLQKRYTLTDCVFDAANQTFIGLVIQEVLSKNTTLLEGIVMEMSSHCSDIIVTRTNVCSFFHTSSRLRVMDGSPQWSITFPPSCTIPFSHGK